MVSRGRVQGSWFVVRRLGFFVSQFRVSVLGFHESGLRFGFGFHGSGLRFWCFMFGVRGVHGFAFGVYGVRDRG